MTEEIEQFFGVYLLYCTNPKYAGRTYIGFTVDPNRRIKQHNAGKKAGGAWKTSDRGPWNMVLTVHGFPNDIAALRFEWAWQHPQRSRRLNHVQKKSPREKTYDYCLRVLAEMLRSGPWDRLPLTLRWLDATYARDLVKPPPMHMPVCYGPVEAKKIEARSASDVQPPDCVLCSRQVNQNNRITCLTIDCPLNCHVACLSKIFLSSPNDYVPVEGACPLCNAVYLWGDLIRKARGCYVGLGTEGAYCYD